MSERRRWWITKSIFVGFNHEYANVHQKKIPSSLEVVEVLPDDIILSKSEAEIIFSALEGTGRNMERSEVRNCREAEELLDAKIKESR